MSDQTVITAPGAHEVWGYLIPAELPEDEIFMPMRSEREARTWVEQSLPATRKLAKRTLGPVELVDE